MMIYSSLMRVTLMMMFITYYIRWRLKLERRWVLLKIPRCDIDEVGEGK